VLRIRLTERFVHLGPGLGEAVHTGVRSLRQAEPAELVVLMAQVHERVMRDLRPADCEKHLLELALEVLEG
jgi:hypothetical protein